MLRLDISSFFINIHKYSVPDVEEGCNELVNQGFSNNSVAILVPVL